MYLAYLLYTMMIEIWCEAWVRMCTKAEREEMRRVYRRYRTPFPRKVRREDHQALHRLMYVYDVRLRTKNGVTYARIR